MYDNWNKIVNRSKKNLGGRGMQQVFLKEVVLNYLQR